jgi:hypothetical protein
LFRASSYLRQLQLASNISAEHAEPFLLSSDSSDQAAFSELLQGSDVPPQLSPDLSYLADFEDALDTSGSGQGMATDSEPLVETALFGLNEDFDGN